MELGARQPDGRRFSSFSWHSPRRSCSPSDLPLLIPTSATSRPRRRRSSASSTRWTRALRSRSRRTTTPTSSSTASTSISTRTRGISLRHGRASRSRRSASPSGFATSTSGATRTRRSRCMLGSKSLDDIIARVEAIQRVSRQDARILTAVKLYKAEVEAHRKSLQDSRAEQARIVDERASQKASIEGQLAERRALYESVKDEIARLQEQERQRQAALAAQARARARPPSSPRRRPPRRRRASIATPTYDPGIIPAAPPPDGTRASQVVSIALQYLGVPYVWGRHGPVRVRLLGAHARTSTRRSGSRCRTTRRPSTTTASRSPTTTSQPGRPRLLQRSRAHGHVHRRRSVHPRAAHRRRRSGSRTCPSGLGDFVGARRIL